MSKTKFEIKTEMATQIMAALIIVDKCYHNEDLINKTTKLTNQLYEKLKEIPSNE